MRHPLLYVALASLLAGCATARRAGPCTPCPAPTVPVAEPVTSDLPHKLYDGATGKETTLGAFLAKARGADLVVFGELHGHPVGAAYQKAILEHLTGRGRPVALAMEFFERDQDEALQAYLAGTMEKEAFLQATKRNKDYLATHGPLVDHQKATGGAVVAANAPRDLVSGFRKSGTSYPEYVATLTPEQQSWLPRYSAVIEDEYFERFSSIMPGSMALPFFRSQSLWDDAMAETMARHRNAHPDSQVFFIVGGFHVTAGKGTITKYRMRRPCDRIVSIVMEGVLEGQGDLALVDEEKGAGDVVLKVVIERPKPQGNNPHAVPPKPEPQAPAAEDAEDESADDEPAEDESAEDGPEA